MVNWLSFHCHFLHSKLWWHNKTKPLVDLAQEGQHFSQGSPNTISPSGSVVSLTYTHCPPFFFKDMMTTEYFPGGWQKDLHTMYTISTAHLNHARWMPLTFFTAEGLRPYEVEQLSQDILVRSGTQVLLMHSHLFLSNLLLPFHFLYEW